MTTMVDGTTDGRTLSDPEITHVLETLARNSGHRQTAVEELEEQGIDLNESTLLYWARDKYKDRYKTARRVVGEQVKEILADAHHSSAATALQIEADAMALVKEKLPNMDGKELAAIIGKASIASGIHTEKGQLLSGEATHRVERTPDEILKSLASKGVKIIAPHEKDAEPENEVPVTRRLPAAS